MATTAIKKSKKRVIADIENDSIASQQDEVETPLSIGEKKRKKKKASESIEDSTTIEIPQAAPVDTKEKYNDSLFSDMKFNELPISDTLKAALSTLGFEKMTQIQAKSIPECLSGSDLIGAAKTGSGKTLR
jgi:ATP-dependent RNA helicase DDX18/HAS1